MQSSSALLAAAAIFLCFHTAAVAQPACGSQTTSSIPLQRSFVDEAQDAVAKFSSADFVREPEAKSSVAQIQQFESQAQQLDQTAGSLCGAIVNYAYARTQNAVLLLHGRQAIATIPLSVRKGKYSASLFFEGEAPLHALIESIDDREEACRLTIAASLNAGQIQSDFQTCELASVDPRSDPLPIPARPVATQLSVAAGGSEWRDPVFVLRAQIALRSIENLQPSFLGGFGTGGILGQLLSESRIDLTSAVARSGVERSFCHALDELFHLRVVQLQTQIGAEKRLLAQLIQADITPGNNDKLIAEVSQRILADRGYAVASARYQTCRDQVLEALAKGQR